MVSSATGHLRFFLFSSKPTTVSEKSHTLTQTIPIFSSVTRPAGEDNYRIR